MSDPKCRECGWRAKYDQNPKSFLGRLWRWHANFCPGWKQFMASIPEEERAALREKYNLKK
jgi:hypothetical protein